MFQLTLKFYQSVKTEASRELFINGHANKHKLKQWHLGGHYTKTNNLQEEEEYN